MTLPADVTCCGNGTDCPLGDMRPEGAVTRQRDRGPGSAVFRAFETGRSFAGIASDRGIPVARVEHLFRLAVRRRER